jgi:hypothetical protein
VLDGLACQLDLGARGVVDGATGEAALVNTVDAPDLGEAYACAYGSGAGPFTVAQLLGPGSDISDLSIPTDLEAPRATVDEGDLVILRGPFGKGDAIAVETWRLRDGAWQRSQRERRSPHAGRSVSCRPRAPTSPPRR